MGGRTEAPAKDGSLVEAAAEAARGGSHLPSLFSALVTGARGCGRAFRRRHLPPRRRPRLAGGLCGGHLHSGGACVQRRTRRDKESSRRGGRVAGVARGLPHGAVARQRRRWRRKVEWSREGSVGCRRARPSPELRRRPRGGEDWAVGRRGAGGSFSAGLFCAYLDRCRVLEPEPKF
jgi:hypothetical protein